MAWVLSVAALLGYGALRGDGTAELVVGLVLAVSWLLAWCFSDRPTALELERRAKGLCVACGYDLRASPGRCPECGRAATTPM